MKYITTSILLLIFTLPVFSQFELSAGFEANFKFSDKAEELVPNSGFIFYGFNASLAYSLTPEFRLGLQTGGMFTSGEYTQNITNPETWEIISSKDIHSKMSLVPMLLSVGTAVYEDSYRIILEVAGGPYFGSRTSGDLIEKKALWGIRPNVGIDFLLTNSLMLGLKSQANIIFTNSEDFKSLDYDYDSGFGYESNDKTMLFLGGASISLTYVFL